ncbi:sugar nucleotide-binding protein [Pacificoceanicola onchidii]|uniref:sugar nucleotide-binding protein n=1 Tax=Pacificoceanicola onchidii TaxID=2562685 RepID=UPI0010A6044E|nr:sugar nucleotide-binding protein [Pacificoceanicola onchidii]
MSGRVLILGGSGRFGRNAAEAFWNAGWRVTLFDRSSDTLKEAARGVDVIVNGWNPAYTDWARDLPALTAQVISAAQASGATVLIPGNVYVFGEDAPEQWDESTPHRALNPLGRLRIDLEAAYKASSVQTIVLRAGDFLDTEASGNWFDKIMAPTLSKGVLTYPGALDRPHAWAYLPDMAQAAVMLAEQRHALPQFNDIPFPGYTLTGEEMAQLCGEALGKPVRAKPMNWLPLRLLSPFWPMARCLQEMRYLWNKPHRLDGSTLHDLLPTFAPTPPAEALARAIEPVLRAKGPDRPKPNGAAPRPAPAG